MAGTFLRSSKVSLWLPNFHPLSGFRPTPSLVSPADTAGILWHPQGIPKCGSSCQAYPSLLYPLRSPHSAYHVTYHITPMSPPQNSSSLVPPTALPQLCSMMAWLRGCFPRVCEPHVAQTLSNNLDTPAPCQRQDPARVGVGTGVLILPRLHVSRRGSVSVGWFVNALASSRAPSVPPRAAACTSSCTRRSRGWGPLRGTASHGVSLSLWSLKPAWPASSCVPGTHHQPGTHIFEG